MAPTYDTSVFISPRLEILLPAEVPESQNPCGICYGYYTASAAQSFRLLTEGENGDEGEGEDEPYFACDPRRLPCSHVFCSICIHRALSRSPACPCCATRFRLCATPTQGFVLAELRSLVDAALVDDGRLDVAVARSLLCIVLSPVFVAVVLSMDVGPPHQPEHPLRRRGVLRRVGLVLLTVLLAPLIYMVTISYVSYLAWTEIRAVENEEAGGQALEDEDGYVIVMTMTDGETRAVSLRRFRELVDPSEDVSNLDFLDEEYLNDIDVGALPDNEEWELVDNQGNVTRYQSIFEFDISVSAVSAAPEDPEEEA